MAIVRHTALFILSSVLCAVAAHADTVVTIAGDPNAPTSNFGCPGCGNPGNTATYGYTITTSDNGSQVVVKLSTTSQAAPDFANLYFESTANDPNTGSNVGFEASNTAVNDAFDPNTGVKYSTNFAGFSSSETNDGTTKTLTVTIPNSFFLNDPDMIGFAKPAPGTDVSLHLSQSFGYSVVGGSAYYPRPQELGLATVNNVTATPEPAGIQYMALSGLAALTATRRRWMARFRS